MKFETDKPLTLTLSPSEGEREQQGTAHDNFNRTRFAVRFSSDARFAHRLTAILPLPFGRGEGRGEGCSATYKS